MLVLFFIALLAYTVVIAVAAYSMGKRDAQPIRLDPIRFTASDEPALWRRQRLN